MALRFSDIMKMKAESGSHHANLNTEKRLELVVDEFHSSSLMTAKYHLDAEKFRSVLNLIIGTTPESRT